MRLIFILLVLANLTRYANGQCESYGIDFVNGGSYFIDNTLSTNFTFLSEFDGCSDDEIVPILVDPDENEYFCSEIPTTPDLTSFLSTCPILQTAMFSGTWYIVIEGLTFAYVRTFSLTVGVPATITATPTVTVGITSTPDAVTSTYISTSSGSTTVAPSTTTVPCKTLSFTSTVFPSPVFTTATKTITFTSTISTTSKTTSLTFTSTAICTPPPFPRAPDPKLQVPWVLPHTTIAPSPSKPRNVHGIAYHKARDLPFLRAHNLGLARRGPDAATVTVTESTSTATITTTSTLAAATVTQTTYTTTISTITPTPITKCSGVTKVTYTTTAPTMTFTRLSIAHTTVYVTKTISVGYTINAVTTPKALATSCINGGGSI